MRKMMNMTLVLSLTLILSACGSGKNPGEDQKTPEENGSTQQLTAAEEATTLSEREKDAEDTASKAPETTAEKDSKQDSGKDGEKPSEAPDGSEVPEAEGALTASEAIELSARYVPDDAELMFAEQKEKGFELNFVNLKTHVGYELKLYNSGVFYELEYKDRSLAIAGEAALSEDEIRARFAEDFPGAEILELELDDEDEGYVYEIDFRRGSCEGSVEYESRQAQLRKLKIKNTVTEHSEFYLSDWPLNRAEEKAEHFIAPEKAAETARALYPDAEITEFELDDSDGRIIYEIELEDKTDDYEVEIDCLSGEVLD